jgi:predicted RND superfamily exporter protein
MRSLTAALERILLGRPGLTLAALLVLIAAALYSATDFRLDASADSLLLENDSDLRYYRAIRARYGSDDYLIVTYSPRDALFSDPVLADLRVLRDAIRALPGVASVTTILDVPLVASPPVSLDELQESVPTLLSPGTDRELARRELTEGELYRQLLMSADGDTTALLVQLRLDAEYVGLLRERDVLREQDLRRDLSAAEQADVARLDDQILARRELVTAEQHETLEQIRGLLDAHRDVAGIRVGGVPMIVDDMLTYILRDVIVFGSGILAFLTLLLFVIFVRPRWVLLSIGCCLAAVILMLGLLSLLRWPVTVVSANFVALLLIFSLSLTVHLIVRYRELHAANPDAEQKWLVLQTLRDKFQPCAYTAATTMVAFASLLVSGIRPVIDFGWMMVIGMLVVLALAFTLFPAILLLLPAGKPQPHRDLTAAITGFCARLVRDFPRATAWFFLAAAGIGLSGLATLKVENRFIDNFRESTEIYQGLVTIDQKLGGTTPFDVILDAPQSSPPPAAQLPARDAAAEEFGAADSGSDEFGDDEFAADEFADSPADEFGDADDLGATSYWYNSFRLEQVAEVHEYLDQLPETGKVLSLHTAMETLKSVNGGETPGTFFLSILYKRLPDSVKSVLFDPYMSSDGNQVRFSVRVFESDPDLRRAELLQRVRTDLVDKLGLEPGQVKVTGMLVLYNNVLQSLYRSQILTMGFVFLAILVMFLLLFRSPALALVAMIPNLLAAVAVLGLMGWLGIPLDIMTITIAAIVVGIGVDDSIHYVHRFREEFARDGDYTAAVLRSHGTIGLAMYYTSVIITAGFAILVFSNFIPTIFFGLFTGFAMIFAMIANLTLLPLLLIRFRPLGTPQPAPA